MPLILTIPFFIWLGFFRNFLNEHIVLIADGRNFYLIVHYYLANLMRGVYPLWDPFDNWGCVKDLYLRFIGEVNPCFYLISILRWMGFSVQASYFYWLVGYYFLGLAGLYVLAQRLFSDKRVSALVVWLVLFSGLSFGIFSDFVVNKAPGAKHVPSPMVT